VVKEIVIHVEGGGDATSKARLREGFVRLFNSLRLEALRRNVRFRVVPGGSRTDTFKEFETSRATRGPGALVILLVDSEGPVQGTPREHLAASDRWDLSTVSDDQVHLMVEVMESWFIADPESLSLYYGQNFAPGSLPPNPNVEAVSKADVLDGLVRATRRTQKREYHKTRHAFDILARLAPEKVRGRAPHCDRLFETIRRYLTP
jgi:hypothetical protein